LGFEQVYRLTEGSRITEDAVDGLFDLIGVRLFPRDKPVPRAKSFKREAELF